MKLSPTFLFSATLLSFIASVKADIYFQSPCGSNDRLNEVNRNVQTNNRLFDSQDNNRGGCAVGEQQVQVYAGSKMSLQWTAQHACGNPQDNCDLVIQYMTDQTDAANYWGTYSLRDGTTTTQAPDTAQADTNAQYGLHENRAYYDECKATSRDKGLFNSNQNLNNNAGETATLQNANGNRNGFECAQERDYYPSAIPNPWVDVVAYVSNQDRCNEIKAASQNTNPTYRCNTTGNNRPITQTACEAKGGKWETVAAKSTKSATIKAVDCQINPMSQRDNSHSVAAGADGQTFNYLFTVPQDAIGKQMVLRIRYNISTGEFDDPTTGDAPAGVKAVDASVNRKNNQGGLDVGTEIGISSATERTTRNYVLTGNPQVDAIGTLDDPVDASGTLGKANAKTNVQLAVNTAQWFRTFEDRSYTFKVLDPASNPTVSAALAAGKSVYNIGVMGHDGNSVQVYPQQETQFTIQDITVTPGDVVHFQWSLSKYNPTANTGVDTAATAAGTTTAIPAGAQQANIVMLAQQAFQEAGDTNNPFQEGDKGRWVPASIDNANAANNFLGLDAATVAKMASGGQSFNSGPIVMKQEGIFPYMSTLSSDATLSAAKAVITVKGNGLNAYQKSASNLNNYIARANKLALAAPPPGSPQSDSQLAQSQSPQAATYTDRPTLVADGSSSSSSSPNYILIGGIAGGVAGLIVLTFLVYTFCLKNKAEDKSMKSVAYQAPTYSPQQQNTRQQPMNMPYRQPQQYGSAPARFTRNDYV